MSGCRLQMTNLSSQTLDIAIVRVSVELRRETCVLSASKTHSNCYYMLRVASVENINPERFC